MSFWLKDLDKSIATVKQDAIDAPLEAENKKPVTPKLKTLVLKGRDVVPHGARNHQGCPPRAQALAAALSGNSTLTKLILSGNDLGDDGAKVFAEALAVNTGLRVMDLGANEISTPGATELGKAIAANKALKTLDLSYNKVGGGGAAALADGLRTNMTLTTLYLHGNHVGTFGSNALADALDANKVEKRYVSGAQKEVPAPVRLVPGPDGTLGPDPMGATGFEPLNELKKKRKAGLGRSLSPMKERPPTAMSESPSPKAAPSEVNNELTNNSMPIP
jgi:hypothetical protein